MFYPGLATFSLLFLLYHRPEKNEYPSIKFENALTFAMTIGAISGCLESPLQLIYQVWMITNGIIDNSFNDLQEISFTDLYGNRYQSE